MNLEDCEEGIYLAEIPAKHCKVRMIYSVYAYYGHYSYSNYYSYNVGDFIPPVISNVFNVPNSSLPRKTDTISATLTELPEAIGVNNITLNYATNDWSSLDIKMQNGFWSATIPGQIGRTNGKFLVKTFDNKDNPMATSIFDYIAMTLNDPPVIIFTELAERCTSAKLLILMP